jgi:hypothetical protein
MTWQWLNARISSRPLILAGPILTPTPNDGTTLPVRAYVLRTDVWPLTAPTSPCNRLFAIHQRVAGAAGGSA